jgi:hypothetical protein
MSITPDHIAKGIKRLERDYPELFFSRREELEKVVKEVHSWFDLFSEKKFAELYGYTGQKEMMHRRQRHHNVGQVAAEYVAVRKCGEEFRWLIRQEIDAHFADDFYMLVEFSKIPDPDDYENPRFVREMRGF